MLNLGGAIGVTVCATIFNDRANLHFQRLPEGLTATNETLSSLIADALQRLGTSEMKVVQQAHGKPKS